MAGEHKDRLYMIIPCSAENIFLLLTLLLSQHYFFLAVEDEFDAMEDFLVAQAFQPVPEQPSKGGSDQGKMRGGERPTSG
jgi:hypothetical protein